MQVLGFTSEERETVIKMLSSILHLGNVYFHRRQLRGPPTASASSEGVEIGSDVEIRWTAHLLQLNVMGISRALVAKTRMVSAQEPPISTPLNIDQALDARDAIAKALYSSLFSWIVNRINKVCSPAGARGRRGKGRRGNNSDGSNNSTIGILDLFGFETFEENSFEQLCINFANELMHHYFNKTVFKAEQASLSKNLLLKKFFNI